MELRQLTIAKVHQGLLQKKFSALELVRAYLDNKDEKKISAFLTITEEIAIEGAKKIDDLIAKNKEISILAGIPLAVKDNIMVEGVRTTCASKILEDYKAPYDATCIKKLKELGVVILGKTNLDEFAMGASTEYSGFFPTRNPYDLRRVPGGSSGGSAAAVAADLCLVALGSDTGGSIRQPASFCGVVGLKPTYGAVSRYGLVAFASSLDQIGPITKTVEDARIVFQAISGKDPKDSTSVESKFSIFNFQFSNLKVGLPKEYFVNGLDSEVEKVIKAAIKKFENLGAKIEEISLPHTKYVIPTYYLVAMSEASANLARYDGIKYGLSKSGGKDLISVYLKSRAEGFGNEVKRRIILGTYALSAGYYDAYYLKAQKVRTLIKQDFDSAFEKVDVIFSPVSPSPAFRFGEKTSDPLSMYLADIFTASINLAGLPAVSVPVGWVGNLPRTTFREDTLDKQNTQKVVRGLPVGLQIIGKPFEENKILEIGKIYEKNE